MSEADTPQAQASFACHRCGACCTDLRERGRGRAEAAKLAPGVYWLADGGGLRVLAWEADGFPRERLAPLIGVPDRASDRLLALAYELEADDCPNYDRAERACQVYEDRPLVCRAFPLLVDAGAEGLEVAASSVCGARVPLRFDETDEPEARLARAYPDAFAPALALPRILARLQAWIRFLAEAGEIDPARGLDPGEVADFGENEPAPITEHLADSEVLEAGDLAARAENTVDEIRERWRASAPT